MIYGLSERITLYLYLLNLNYFYPLSVGQRRGLFKMSVRSVDDSEPKTRGSQSLSMRCIITFHKVLAELRKVTLLFEISMVLSDTLKYSYLFEVILVMKKRH